MLGVHFSYTCYLSANLKALPCTANSIIEFPALKHPNKRVVFKLWCHESSHKVSLFIRVHVIFTLDKACNLLVAFSKEILNQFLNFRINYQVGFFKPFEQVTERIFQICVQLKPWICHCWQHLREFLLSCSTYYQRNLKSVSFITKKKATQENIIPRPQDIFSL